MKLKLTPLEKKWILYDVGNSAFTLMVATLFPIYFNSMTAAAGLSDSQYLAYWGYATSFSTILLVLISPFLGALSDKKGRKKVLFSLSIILGSIATGILGFAKEWLAFIIIYVIAKVLYSLSLVFYDSMLADVTTEERMDTVSSQGYAWGYIGSCIPFVIALLIVLQADTIGIGTATAMTISFILIGAWWLIMSLPLLKAYRQKHYIDETQKQSFLLVQLGRTLKEMYTDKKIFLFVIGFFFYIDGVYTIIDMSTAYGSALGLDSTGLLLALLVTQIVAFPSAITFGRLAQKKKSEFLISVCIIAYFGIAVFAVFLSTQLQFWILAICVGIFQGGIQALSRSYFTKIVPSDKTGEYFGLLDICGKGASVFGTLMMSVLTQVTGRQQIGVGAIAIFFVIGFFLFRLSAKMPANRS